jgi:uncharacterized protein (TIGR02452 family)
MEQDELRFDTPSPSSPSASSSTDPEEKKEEEDLTQKIFSKHDTKFSTLHADSFEAASKFVGDGKITVLNFASAKKAGGGFLNGAMAQEESLCYSSNLYTSLAKNK